MNDRELVEWIAQARVGQALPSDVSKARAAVVMHQHGFRLPLGGEQWPHWCADAQAYARRVVDSETWAADGLK